MWNGANVLAISRKLTSNEVTRGIIDAWLSVEKPDSERTGSRENGELFPMCP